MFLPGNSHRTTIEKTTPTGRRGAPFTPDHTVAGATLILLLLLLPLVATHSDAADTRADMTLANDWIEWSLDIRYDSMMSTDITASIKVHEIDTINATFTADGIRNATAGNASSPLIAEIEELLDTQFDGYIGQAFSQSTFTTRALDVKPGSLEGGVKGDAYDPPVEFTLSCAIELDTHSYFTDDDLVEFNVNEPDRLLSGCLLAGGTITDRLTLEANKGQKVSYVFYKEAYILGMHDEAHATDLKATLPVTPAGAIELQDNSFSIVTLDARKDTSLLSIDADLAFKAQNPVMQTKEDWSVEVNMDMPELDQLSILPSPIRVKALDGNVIGFNPAPALTGLRFLGADTLRMLYDARMVNIEGIKSYISDSMKDLEGDLDRALNASNTGLVITWDMNTVDHCDPPFILENGTDGTIMGVDRPLLASLTTAEAIVPHLTGNISAWAARGFLNAGASTSIDLDLDVDAHITTHLTLPEHLLLRYRQADSTGARRQTYTLEGTNSLDIASDLAPSYTSSRAIADIRTDIKDVNPTGATSVDFPVSFAVDARLHRIDPDSINISAYLPEGVKFDRINSDAFRLAFQEGVVSKGYVIREMKRILLGNVTPYLADGASVSVVLLENTSAFDGNIGDMTDTEPLIFDITIDGDIVVDDVRDPQIGKNTYSVTVYAREFNFPIGGLTGWTSNYHVILPAGLTVESEPRFIPSRGTSSEPVTGTENERYFVDVILYDNAEGDINMKIGVTPGLVVEKAWPCLLGLFLLLAIIVAVIIILIVRSKKKKNRGNEQKDRKGRGGDGYQDPLLADLSDPYGPSRGSSAGNGRGSGRSRPPGPGPIMLMFVLLF